MDGCVNTFREGGKQVTVKQREEMIAWIQGNFNNWESLRQYILSYKADAIIDWYVCYEGYEPEDMYLQTEHPCSDACGLIITHKDCF